MTLPTKRTLLTLAGTAMGSTAGCLSRIPGMTDSENGSNTVEIYQIAVQNRDGEHHEITVVIEDGGGTVLFREKLALESGAADGFMWPVDGAADYTLRATAGSMQASKRLANFTDDDEHCVAPVVRVRHPDRLSIRPHAYNECTMAE